MAKVIAPFKIVGTLDDLTFYVAGEDNLVREKGTPGISKEEFKNPIFDRIRQHGVEFGSCVRQSVVFRLLVKRFFDFSKDVSFAGRVNQLLFDILKEDIQHPVGQRELISGLATSDGQGFLLGFEANKLRPLPQVLKKKIDFDWRSNELVIQGVHLEKDIVWPEPEANQVHFQLGIANWNCLENKFENQFSEILTFTKSSKKETIRISTPPLEQCNLWIAFIYLGFSNQHRKNIKVLHRKWNTATCIAFKGFK